jgi:hypothetical protein
MKNLILIFFALLVLTSGQLLGQKAIKKKDFIIIEGTILKMSSPVRPAHFVTRYRLIKYKVNRVCKGKFDNEEIVIDHHIFFGDEDKDVKIGDKVYVAFNPSRTIPARFNSPEIRDSKEQISKFYIGNKVYLAEKPNCSYDEDEITGFKKFGSPISTP